MTHGGFRVTDDETQFVNYLWAEVDRLQTLLRAERVQNGRYVAAVAHLKDAFGQARGLIDAAWSEADNGEYLRTDTFEDTAGRLDALVAQADALILPVAKDA